MFSYRFTALLLPAFLLLFLPALAAYPWQLPLGAKLAVPFLALLTILFCAVRYPGLLSSPMVFISGICCDLFTRSPLGYWTLLFLITLACARTTTSIVKQWGLLVGYICFAMTLVTVVTLAWALASFYEVAWQDLRENIDGMIMALVLLPVPALLLVGLEKLLIVKAEKEISAYSRISGR